MSFNRKVRLMWLGGSAAPAGTECIKRHSAEHDEGSEHRLKHSVQVGVVLDSDPWRVGQLDLSVAYG